MSYKEETYNAIRKRAFAMLLAGDIPQSVVFESGSAYCTNVTETIFETLIPQIDSLLLQEDPKPFTKAQMQRYKKTLYLLLDACTKEENKQVSIEEWSAKQLAFTSYKLPTT